MTEEDILNPNFLNELVRDVSAQIEEEGNQRRKERNKRKAKRRALRDKRKRKIKA